MIYVKMVTLIVILTFKKLFDDSNLEISLILVTLIFIDSFNFMPILVEHERSIITSRPGLGVIKHFHAQVC